MKIKTLVILLLGAVGVFGCETVEKRIVIDSPKGWEILKTPTKASLRGLSPVTTEIAWASGSGGVWMRTVDSGKTWTSGIIDGLDSVDFRDIEAFDASTAIAMSSGQPAVIYKTTDGG